MIFLFLLILLVGVRVAIGVTRGVINRRRRHALAAAMREVARRFGWTYVGDQQAWLNIISVTPPAVPLAFRRNGTIGNVVQGVVDGAAVTWLHLEAQDAAMGWGPGVEALRNSTRHTYCLLQVRGVVPSMVVCLHSDWAARRTQPGDVRDRVMTGDTSFDAHFVVSSASPDTAAAALTPSLKRHLVSTGLPCAVGDPTWVMTWREGLVIDGEHLAAQARALVHIASLL